MVLVPLVNTICYFFIPTIKKNISNNYSQRNKGRSKMTNFSSIVTICWNKLIYGSKKRINIRNLNLFCNFVKFTKLRNRLYLIIHIAIVGLY